MEELTDSDSATAAQPTTTPDEAEAEQEPEVNISRLREMAIRGSQYTEPIEDFTYFGLSGDLYVLSLPDPIFLPLAAILESRLDIKPEEAQEMMEEEKDPETGEIDPTQFDTEFVMLMAEFAVKGINCKQGVAEGETEQGLREIFAVNEDMEFNDSALAMRGGKTLEIAERVLSVSSDAEAAKSFRRDGGGQ